MKKIILANIGNRNLKYKGETYSVKSHGGTLREWTKGLLDNFEEVKPDLSINILDVLLDTLKGEVEHAILFSSNQINEEKQDQDTLYEAEILNSLITEQYDISVDSSKQVTCKVTDNDALLRFYRKELRAIRQEFPTHKIVICDAGGTAQQKSALKIMAEFLLNESDFEVLYVNPDGSVEDVAQLEYRRVIETEHLIALIKNGNFEAAEQIASQQGWDKLSRLCKIGDLRLLNLWSDAQSLISKDWTEDSYAFLKLFRIGKTSTNYDELKKYLKHKHDFFVICEKLQIAEYYLINNEYTKAVVAISIFIEAFVNELIERNSEFPIVSNYLVAKDRLLEEVSLNHQDIVAFFGNQVRVGLPLNIKFAQKIVADKNHSISYILESIGSLNSRINGTFKGIDALRNDVAHRGKGVTKLELYQASPNLNEHISNIKKLLGLPQSNPFEELKCTIINETKVL